MTKKVLIAFVAIIFLSFILMINTVFKNFALNRNSNMDFNTKRVVLIVPHPNNEYWDAVAQGLEQGCKENNISLEVKEVVSSGNSEEIVQLMQTAINEQVDAIVLKGDIDYGSDILLQAKQNGIVIAFVDSDYTAFDRDFYIGTDNYGAGKLLAQNVVKHTPKDENGEINIAILAPTINAGNIMQRKQGFEDYCKTYSNVNIVAVYDNEWSSSVAVGHINLILDTMPEVTAIVALEGYSTIALSTVTERRHVRNTKLFGFDLETELLIQAIQNEQITGVINQQPYNFGYNCALQLQGLWGNFQLDNDTIYLPAEYVDKTNLNNFMQG